jgi:hypothetical protein
MFEKPGGVSPYKKMPVIPVNKVLWRRKNNWTKGGCGGVEELRVAEQKNRKIFLQLHMCKLSFKFVKKNPTKFL